MDSLITLNVINQGAKGEAPTIHEMFLGTVVNAVHGSRGQTRATADVESGVAAIRRC